MTKISKKEAREQREHTNAIAEKYRVDALPGRVSDVCPSCDVIHRYRTEGRPNTLCVDCGGAAVKKATVGDYVFK